jgi:hypothetical protein
MASRAILFVLLLAAGIARAAEPALGTLFFSAEERSRLDRLRRGESEPSAAPVQGEGSAVTGFVKRSDGRHTVWIDGRAVSVRGPQAAEVLDPRAVRAYVDQGEESLKIERKPAR